MSQEQPQIDREYDFAHGQHFMESIRSSGYKNAAMAIGELVDNSIQADAENIDILVKERRSIATERRVRRINEIAILDDGTGMEKDLLRRSLKLGDGTHFEDDDGIGKYGVGLPQASVSQAKKVNVWTWQNGIDNAFHTCIDLTDDDWVEKGIIPEPEEKSIPDIWKEMTGFDEGSGTLVVWSEVDRCSWKRARTLYSHSQDLVGRMYRNWLHPDTDYRDVDISLILYDEDNDEVDETWNFQPNDPLYLMEGTSVQLPEGIPDPMFEQYGELERTYSVNPPGDKETDETVTMTFSVSKPKTRQMVDGRSAGHASHGKHAKNNIGLSIVREGRELTLDKNWAGKDPRNRWWGAQVEFGRKMDDIFGVTNNKQGADRLSEVANTDWEDYAEEGESTTETRDRLKEEDFSTFVCLDIKHEIYKAINQHLIDKVEEIGEYNVNEDEDEEETRHENTPERHGTEVTRDRKEEGKTGESDEETDLSEDEVVEEIQTRLEKQGVDEDTIEEVTGDVVDHGLKFSFVEKPLAGPGIFSVEPTAGAILIGLNKDHLAYNELFSSLDLENEEELEEKEAAEKLKDANDALKLLLEAWARMEDEATPEEKHQYRDIRTNWGMIARDFLKASKPESELD